MIDKGVCDSGYICNPSNFECECDKLCDVGEYLDNKNCKCRKQLTDKLVEECTETVKEVKIASKMSIKINAVLVQCTLCYFHYFSQLTLVLLLILFTTNTWIVMKKMFLNMIMSIKQTNINYV